MKQSTPTLQTVFLEAQSITNHLERDAFVRAACGSNEELLKQVETLLQAQSNAGKFLPESPARASYQANWHHLASAAKDQSPLSADPNLTEKLGDRIGRYRLIRALGEGGCGMVYLADQESPVRRQVALKVIKLGMDTKSVVARFDAERQALAMMDHPHIAKVFDAGSTEAGRPYFVMELVQGIKITDYCDQRHMAANQRLELFVQVCRAAQHAHQKGIIHRDLKPSNILVAEQDGLVVPKVIDFGIAKATEARLTDRTLFTAFEVFVGTPAYMSPEQTLMTGRDIDTRSDLYSLGVVLYELLTGQTPFDPNALLAKGLDGMRQIIREREAPKPSARLRLLPPDEFRRVAATRGLAPPKLIPFVRGDLDSIVGKCLEKEPARRYQTALELAEEVSRFLRGEPIAARPITQLGRAWRWCRRRPSTTAAAAMILTLVITVALGAPMAAFRIDRSRKEAVAAAQTVRRSLVRQYVANGTRLMNDGDLFGALLWYTEGLHLDAGDPNREEPHRVRIASVLRQCPKLLSISLHGDKLYHSCFSPDGERLLTASDDHTARVWDFTQGKELLVLHHANEVYDAEFSPDGRFIITSSKDHTARIWKAGDGTLLHTLSHQDTVWRSSFGPDGREAITASRDGSARIWDTGTGTPMGEPLNHPDAVERATFSPDGRFIATETSRGKTYLWEHSTRKLLLQADHYSSFSGLTFSPDSSKFLTVAQKKIRVWDSASLRELPFSPLRFKDEVNQISWSADGGSIVGASRDLTAQAWDSSTGRPIFSPAVQHQGMVLTAQLSPDGRHFLSGGQDTIARMRNVRTGARAGVPLKFILHVKSLLFNPDGRRILGHSCDQAARVWDQAIEDVPGPPRPSFERESLRLKTPDGKHAVIKADDLSILLVDAATKQAVRRFVHTNFITYFALSRSGRTLITAVEPENVLSSMPNPIFLWDVESGRLLNTQPMVQPFQLLYASFSPDGDRVLTCGFDYTARVWDARTGAPIGAPMPHRQKVTWGAFSPNGLSVVTASADKIARVWDATTGQPMTPPLVHGEFVAGAQWTADQRRLLTLTVDDHVQVWDVEDGEPLTPPRRAAPPLLQGSTEPPAADPALEPDPRPVEDLVLLAQMLAVGRIDSSGNLVPLPVGELVKTWQQLHQRYPEQSLVSKGASATWHYREALASEEEENRPAALFHIKQALRLDPTNRVFQAERVVLDAAHLGGNREPTGRYATPTVVPSRDSRATQNQIDLSAHYNRSLRDSLTEPMSGDDLAFLPSGLQSLGGLLYDIRGVIHLSGGGMVRRKTLTYPETVTGIQIHRRCQQLHFLHSSSYNAPDGTIVAAYTIHYADGEILKLPVKFGHDIGDWRLTWTELPDAAVAWSGPSRSAPGGEDSMRLFTSTRQNPRPEVEITSIDFTSAMTDACPFLIALTVD